jgi:hypothetical protein
MSAARRATRAGAPLALCLAAALAPPLSTQAGCGYHALYAAPEGERLHVALARALVADAAAADEVLSGAREVLAKEGALAPGDGYPRIEIEVLRADESSEGVQAVGGAPAARGTEVGVVARAWVVRANGAPLEHDTGDVHAMDVVAVDTRAGALDPRADALHHADALRAVARRVGRRLALHVLGHPVAPDEGIGRER